MIEDVRTHEQAAIDAQNSGDYERAILLWLELLAEYPRWEHGLSHYHLAGCYEEAGRLDEAEAAYRRAIELSPEDPMFSETLVSFVEARKAGLI